MLSPLFAAATVAAAATGAPAPHLNVGDAWTFDRVTDRGTQGFADQRLDMRIERVGVDTMVVGIKPSGAPRDFEDHISGLDWSQRRLVDGRQSVTSRPFAFPLAVGATWTADWVDPTVHGRVTSAHHHVSYRVAGMEDVTTPAGTFHAYKIVVEGETDAQFAPAANAVAAVTTSSTGATTVTQTNKAGATTEHGTSYGELFYDPKVKYYVKTLEDLYNSENVRTGRTTQMLSSYSVTP